MCVLDLCLDTFNLRVSDGPVYYAVIVPSNILTAVG